MMSTSADRSVARPVGRPAARRGFARLALLAAVAGSLAVAGVGAALAQPAGRELERRSTAPRPRPIATKWEFDFRPGPLRIAQVTHDGATRLYYYLTYQVVNRSGEDRPLAPSFELRQDTGLSPVPMRSGSGSGVPSEVVDALIARLGNPLLLDQVAIVGTLGQGPENARDGIVVWPATDDETDSVTVYASGFSGEFQVYRTRDRETGRYRDHQLRKTLLMQFATPGKLGADLDTPLAESEREWVMR